MIYFILLIMSMLTLNSCDLKKNEELSEKNSMNIHAPEFNTGLDWLNTDKPIKLKELRGKIVLIDFWTYCCINCMHILPDLKLLEEKYKNELVVIGVHSAKFATEKETENIREAILRYDITHPVVNDNNFDIWQQFGAHSWPTLILIDAKGYIVGAHSGEGIYDIFDYNIGNLINKQKDLINYTPITFALEKDKASKSLLNFPGKIIADKLNNKLIITDSNNNRILITDETGKIHEIIGTGTKGLKDGNFEEAEFNQPQGIAKHDNILYVADTENHAIRKVNLIKRTVETISGTGKQLYSRNPQGNAINMGLNSPWDLTIHNNYLYIAMAGPHQIWKINLTDNSISLHAGNGYENIVDSDLLNSQLAQPSGIIAVDNYLYFADSEVSAIRSADINVNGKVKTLIGTGLFNFGDKDGDFKKALLQHPLGLTYNDNILYIADTYNNKIKAIDLNANTISTVAGNGLSGNDNGANYSANFNEPSGLAYLNGKLYVTDTNNNLIRVIDLKTNTTSTLELFFPNQNKSKLNITSNNYLTINDVNTNKLNKLYLLFNPGEDKKLNTDIQSFIGLYNKSRELINNYEIKDFNTHVTIDDLNADEDIYLNIVIYYCDKMDEGQCYIKDITYLLKYNSNGKTELVIDLDNQ